MSDDSIRLILGLFAYLCLMLSAVVFSLPYRDTKAAKIFHDISLFSLLSMSLTLLSLLFFR